MKKIYTSVIAVCILCFSQNLALAQGIPARQETNLDQVYNQFNLSGEGVVIALIDRGIDYFHPDFIDENGNTRLLYLYDMINQEGANDPDNPYGVGTIFTEDEINASLKADGSPLSTDRYGHGTAISGIAAGNGTGTSNLAFQGVAPKAKIIVVKAVQDYFPPFDDQPGQDGFYDPSYIPIAIQFVADKFEELNLPGVALLNMGSIGGPTDGTSTICRAIDNFVDTGHPFVCGVGDDGGNDNHASATVSQDGIVEIKIQKGEPGNLRFDLWYSEDDRFDVSITRPDNSIEGPFTAPATANDANDRFLTGINYYHRGANVDFAGATSNRRELMIDLTGATGEYKITLTGSSINGGGKFHAVLNPSNNHNTNEFVSHVVAGYSINDFSSAANAISPTDYVVKNNYIDMDGINRQFTGQGDPGELWIGSSFGPTQNDQLGVDFAATGELLYAAYSPNTWYSHFPHLLVQGGDNNYGIQNAVSAAAPLTTGVIALLLEMNKKLTPAQIKSVLQSTAWADSFTGTVPNNKWGFGKLDALAAIKEVESLGIFSLTRKNQVFNIFPNPANEQITIRYTNNLDSKIQQIRIFNNLGQVVLQSDKDIKKIDISNFMNGIYHLVIETDSGISSGKFLKN